MTTVPQTFDQARSFHQAGDLRQAEQLYRQILQSDPGHVEALHQLGLVANQVGRNDLAVEYMSQALRLQPQHADLHNDLGIAFAGQGNMAEAAAYFRQAMSLRPDFAEAHSNLGNALRGLGKPAEALACFQRAIDVQPHFVQAHNNLGNALRELGRPAEAIACFHQALRLQPDYPEAHNNLGIAFAGLGKLAEAAASFRQAIHLRPAYAKAHYNLGNALKEAGQFQEAGASFREALRLWPEYAEAHNNLGTVLKDTGTPAESVPCFREALRLRPGFAEAYHNLANAYKDQGQLDEAVACFQEALRLRPDFAEAHTDLAMTWLLQGDFERGWPENEWRWRCTELSFPSFTQPLWDGSRLRGRTILLHAEQGLGDTLQFVRYAPLIQERGGRVLVLCPAALVRLLASCPGIERLLTKKDVLPPFDVHAPLLSLPRILGTTLGTVPARVPYLAVAPEQVEHWRQEFHAIPGFKIGISWQGNPGHTNDRNRSVPLACFEPLTRLTGVQLFSLQKGAGAEPLARGECPFPIIDLSGRLEGFADTAAILKNLDLVVCVDTALAHCAGALAVPVWVVLPFAPDWRWLLGREDNPWYPTLRVFRQSQRRQWPEVMERLAMEIKKLLPKSESMR